MREVDVVDAGAKRIHGAEQAQGSVVLHRWPSGRQANLRARAGTASGPGAFQVLMWRLTVLVPMFSSSSAPPCRRTRPRFEHRSRRRSMSLSWPSTARFFQDGRELAGAYRINHPANM